MSNESSENVIRFRLQIDGADDAVKEFQTVAEASEQIDKSIESIKSKTKTVLPDTSRYFEEGQRAIGSSFKRIKDIDEEMAAPNIDSYRAESLAHEKEMLRRSIEATMQDISDVSELSSSIYKQLGGSRKNSNGLKVLNETISDMYSAAKAYAGTTRRINGIHSTNVLMSDQQIASGLAISDAGKKFLTKMNISAGSQTAQDIFAMIAKTAVDQVKRSDYMKQIAGTSDIREHVFESFSQMLPTQFRNFHNGVKVTPQPGTPTRLTTSEFNFVKSMLLENPYFAEAAEKTGMARRENGVMQIYGDISREMLNKTAGNLYNRIVNAAKGMPMFGIKDVDDPDKWENIARKTNKPFIGGMNAARQLADAVPWLAPEKSSGKASGLVQTGYRDVGTVTFGPMIKRYEAARYTLDDLRNGTSLNDTKRLYDKATNENAAEEARKKYFSLDHSLHLENIFRHRTRNQTPENNEAIDDVIYLQMEKELGDNQLDPARREDLEKQYANYVLNGITTMVRGRKMHYSFSRVNATSGLGFEFIADPIYNKILQEDPTYFTAGLKEQGFRKWAPAAGALEYGNKNATTGQNIRDLYGSDLPGLDKVKIALVNMEHTTKGTNENGEEVGAGVNGASWINAKYTPAGFQGRIHGVKSALNRLDMKELYNLFGGNLVAPSVNGTTIRLTGEEDFIINLADIKNAEERFGKRDEKGDLVKDDKGNVVFEDAETIIESLKRDYQKYGVFVARTMDQANGRTHWMSRQMANVLKGDKSFSDMTTKAFLDEFHRVGTLEGALDTVFADDSETRDLLLRTNGAIMGSRMIQSRIEDYRKEMMARVSQGDVLLPNDLNAYRAMAGVWAPSAFMNAMKKINVSGTGMKKEGEQGSFYDTMYKALENDKQREFLDLVTLEDNEVAFNKSMAKTFGIYRYPATLSSAQKANNATVGDSKRAQAIRSVISKLGMDQSGIYVSPSSPLMDLLQDADFDGDVLELIEMSLTGRDAKSGRKVTAAEVMDRAFSEGMKRIEERRKRGEYTDEEARRRKDQFTRSVYGDLPDKDYSIELHATKADGTPDMERRTKAAMTVSRYASAAAQNGSYMGAPDAANRNAAQVPWSKDVMTALMDAELMYSVNSVRGKKGKEYYVDGKTHSEYLNVLSNYRPITEFFHLVDKSRDKYGNVNPSDLIDLAKGSDGLEGARFWNTNLPFKTMSGNVRSALLSRFFAKRRGFDINADYDWENIFDTVLGKKDESTALGRMQAGLRDTWMGILNADFLAPSNETIAYLNELRDKAIQEQEGIVAEQRKSAGFQKKGSNVSIATNLVDRLGGKVILNARTLGLTEESIKTGENKEWYDDLIKLGFSPESIVGNVDGLQRLLQMQTDTSSIDKVLARGNKSTRLSRALDLWNTQTDTQKKARIDSMKKLSFSTISQFAEDPASFLEMLVTGKENEVSNTAIEFGQAAHFAIEHFMRGRMNNPDKGKSLSPERLAELQEEARTAFKEYLGIEKTHKYTPDKLPTRGFNDAERRLMDDPSSWLHKRYRDIMNFFDDGLMKFMNDEEWEVIGIESSNIGNEEEGKDGKKKAKRASADRMVIEGKGKKLENPDEDVEFTGAYDLMFKNRKSGEIRVVDIKNYGKGDTLDAVGHWRPQQLLYAGQLIKNGVDVKSIQFMLPLQNAMRDLQFDARDIERNDENVKDVVKLIQKLGTGRQTAASVTELAAKANEILFGETKEKDYSDHFRGGGKKGKYGGATVNSGTITDALYLHDRFSEAEKESDDIASFIGQETRARGQERSSFRNWQNAFIRNDNILGTANFFENAKKHDEAEHLEGKYKENLKALHIGLGNSIINDQNQFAEDIRGTLVGGEGTEKGQSLAKMYGRFQRKQEDIANKRDLLRSIIEANEKEIEEQGIDPEGYEKNRDKLAREGKFIDSLIKNIDAFTAKDATPQAKRGAKGRLAQLISKNADMFGENALLSNETLYDLQQLSPTGILSAKATLEAARERNKQNTETNEDMIAKAQANPNVLKKNYDESKRELDFLDEVKRTQKEFDEAYANGDETQRKALLKKARGKFTKFLNQNQDLAEKFGINDIKANMSSENEIDRQSAYGAIEKARIDVKGRVNANESLWKNSVERVNGLISENEQLKSAETMSKIGDAGVQDLISKFKENFNNELSRYFEGIEHQFADMMGDKHGVEDIVGKAKSNFIKSVYQAITDVEELAKEGAISPEEAEQKKAHYQAMLRDENMHKVGEKAKKDALIDAGIISETPQEKAQKWLDKRNKAREATSREKLDKLKATADRWGDIYEKDRSPEALRLWGEARQRYLKEAVNSGDATAKARDEKIAGTYAENIASERERKVADLLRPEHQQLSVADQVKRAVEDKQAALVDQLMTMGTNDPGFMDVFNRLYNDPEYWENFKANETAKRSLNQTISNAEGMASVVRYNQMFDRIGRSGYAENLLVPGPMPGEQRNNERRLSDILLGRAYAADAVQEDNGPATFDVSQEPIRTSVDHSDEYAKYYDQRARAAEYIKHADERYRDLLGRRNTLDEFGRRELDILGSRLGYTLGGSDTEPYVDNNVRDRLLNELTAEYGRQDATNFAGRMLQAQQRQETFNNQAAWAEAARDRQYSRMNHNLFFNNRSRILGYYNRGEDQRFALQREASSNLLKADQMKASIAQMKNERQSLTGDAAALKDKDIANATAQMISYQKAANSAYEESMHFSQGINIAGAFTKTFGDSISSIAHRLGRRIFMAAGREITQFVKEYDKAMTEIQMITLKSDTEMDSLGEGLITKAKELSISFSEISKMATDLYRQGLTDEEMDERLDVIAKFSKVSGAKPADATKLITTAMNTGLVTDAQYAADVISAIGDSAATNAIQLEKGIEKAGAAAAVDGTTYAQLVSLLTAVTATTQVSGSVAGTTLNSIFGRMNKIGTNELIYDENGNAMSGSAIATLLRGQGIATNNEDGSRRSTYDILYELAQKYDTMSDDEQRQISTAIAGTRQFSNFSAIMTGIREGDIDRYMELAGEASGITDKKFDIYTGSLQASLNNLKTSFDELVNDVLGSDISRSFIDAITKIITSIDSLIKKGPELASSFTSLLTIGGTLLTVAGALAMMTGGGAPIGMQMAGLGVMMLSGAGIAGIVNSGFVEESAETKYKNFKTEANSTYQEEITDIDRAKVLKDKGENRTKQEDQEYKSLLYKLSARNKIDVDEIEAEKKASLEVIESSETPETDQTSLGETDESKSISGETVGSSELSNVEAAASGATSAISSMANSAENAADKLANYGDEVINQAEKGADKRKFEKDKQGVLYASDALAEAINKDVVEYNIEGHATSYGLLGKLWHKNEDGTFSLDIDSGYDLTKEQRGTLAHMMYNAKAGIDEDAGFGYIGLTKKNFNQFTEEDWKSHFEKESDPWVIVYGNLKLREAFEKYLNFDYQNYDTGIDTQRESFISNVASYLSENWMPDDETATAVAENLWADYGEMFREGTLVTGKKIQTLLNNLFGFGGDNESWDLSAVKEKIREYKNNHGIELSNTEKAEELGLEYLGAGTYYELDGKRLTLEEAQKIVDEANQSRQYRVKGSHVASEDTVYETGEEAQAAGQAYTFTDSEGNTKYFTSEEERNKYAEENGIYASTYTDKNGKEQTIYAIGKQNSIDKMNEAIKKEAQTTYRIKNNGVEIEGAGFSSLETAQDYAARLTAEDQKRYDEELAVAKQKQEDETLHAYQPIMGGPSFSGYGEEGLHKVRTAMIDDSMKNAYLVVDKDGNIIEGFENNKEAQKMAYELSQPSVYNAETGEFLGRGDAGYAKSSQKAWFVDGERIGVGAEGEAEAKRIRQEAEDAKTAAIEDEYLKRNAALVDLKKAKDEALANAEATKSSTIENAEQEMAAAIAKADSEQTEALASAEENKLKNSKEAEKIRDANIAGAQRELADTLAAAKQMKREALAKAKEERDAAITEAKETESSKTSEIDDSMNQVLQDIETERAKSWLAAAGTATKQRKEVESRRAADLATAEQELAAAKEQAEKIRTNAEENASLLTKGGSPYSFVTKAGYTAEYDNYEDAIADWQSDYDAIQNEIQARYNRELAEKVATSPSWTEKDSKDLYESIEKDVYADYWDFFESKPTEQPREVSEETKAEAERIIAQGNADADQLVKDAEAKLAKINQDADNQIATINAQEEASKNGAETVYQTQLQDLQDAYGYYISEAESTKNRSIEEANANYQKAIEAANADYNTAIEDAKTTYAGTVKAAGEVFDETEWMNSTEYETAKKAAEDKHAAAVKAAEGKKAEEIELAGWAYDDSVELANGLFNDSVGKLNAEYEKVRARKLPEITSIDEYIAVVEELNIHSVKPFKELAKDIQSTIPELDNIDPAIVYEAFGQLPKAVQTVLDTANSIGLESGTVLEEAKEELAEKAKRIQAHRNIFAGSTSVGYSTWAQKNSTKIIADDLISILNNPNNNITDLQSFVDYVNDNNIQSVGTLLKTDANFAKIFNDAIISDKGEVEYTPEGMMDAIINYLYSASSFGAKTTSLREKGTSISGVFNDLLNGTTFATSELKNQAYNDYYNGLETTKADEEYKKQYNKAKKEYDEYYKKERFEHAKGTALTFDEFMAQKHPELVNKDEFKTDYLKKSAWRSYGEYMQNYIRDNGTSSGSQTYDEYYNDFMKENTALTDSEWMKKYGYNILNADQQGYLEDIFGKDLASRLSSKGGVSNAELKYARTVLSNATYGISGLTNRQRNEFAQTMINDFANDQAGQYSDAMVTALTSGFSGDTLKYWEDFVTTKSEVAKENLLEQLSVDEAALEKFDSVDAARAYAKSQYDKTNKARNIAQKAYEQRGQYSSAKDFIENARKLENWTEVESTQEFYELMDKYIDPKTGELKSEYNLDQFYDAFSNLTKDYQGGGYTSRSELADQARKALKSSDRSTRNQNGEALKTILGEDLYNRWKENETFDAETMRFINEQINRYISGSSSMTSYQRLTGIGDIISQAQNGTLKGSLSDQYKRSQYGQIMSQWGNWDEYAQLIEAQGTARFKELGGQEKLDTLNQELLNLQKNAEIDFKVTGLKALEEAGKLIAGTASDIEIIMKGGWQEAEKINEIQQKSYTEGQQLAKLYNGTKEQQIEELGRRTSYDETYIRENFDEILRQEKETYEAGNEARAASLLAEIEAATTEETKQQAIKAAELQGFEYTEGEDYNKKLQEYLDTGLYILGPDGKLIAKDSRRDRLAAKKANEDLSNLTGSSLKFDSKLLNITPENEYDKYYTKAQSVALSRRALNLAGLGQDYNAIKNSFDEKDWAAITSFSPELASWLKMDEAQRNTTEGQNLKRTFEIEFEVTEVKQLEEAGELLEGTADTIEKLKKGGRFEIEAVVKMSTETYEQAQQSAKLYNGTREQQEQAAMAVLEMGETQFYQDAAGNIERAKNKDTANRESLAKSLAAEWEAATPERQAEIDELAAAAGFERIEEEVEEAYSIGEALASGNSFVEKIGNVIGWFGGSGKRTKKQVAYKDLGAGDVDVVNPFRTMEESWTSQELAEYAQGIISGENVYSSDNAKKYEAAINSMGFYGKQYGREKAAYEELKARQAAAQREYEEALSVDMSGLGQDQLAIANKRLEDAEKNLDAINSEIAEYGSGEVPEKLKRLQTLAAEETRQAQEAAADQQRLEDLKLSGDMFGYAKESYRQNNKAGLAANAIYESLKNADADNIEKLFGVLGDEKNKDNWEELFKSSPELAKRLDDLGIKMKANGQWDLSGLKNSALDTADALATLTSIIAQHTEQYSDDKKINTNAETYKLASDYLSGTIYDEETQKEAVQTVFGNSEASQLVFSSRDAFEAGRPAIPEGYTVDAGGVVYDQYGQPNYALTEERRAYEKTWAPYSEMTDFERSYYQTKTANYGEGIPELTGYQNMTNLVDLLMAAQNSNVQGGLSGLVSGDHIGMLPQIAGNIEGISEWASVISHMQEMGQGLNDYTRESEEWSKAIENANITADQFEQTTSDLTTAIRDANVELHTSGEFADEAANSYKNLAKGGKTAAQEVASMIKKGYNLTDIATAIGKASGKAGKSLDPKTKKIIADYLQMTADEVAKLTESELKAAFANGNTMKAVMDELNDSVIEPALNGVLKEFQDKAAAGELTHNGEPITYEQAIKIIMKPDGETVDMSSMESLAKENESQAIEALSALGEGRLAEWVASLHTESSGDQFVQWIDAKTTKAGNSSGKYSKHAGGGGGGGGGEESEVQKMLARHKDELAEQEHKIKMEEIYQTHFDFINDYDSYFDSLDREEAAYDKLSEIYKRQIEEMKGMMGSVEAATSDYYSLRDALRSAEEGLADIQNRINAIETKKVDIIISKEEIEDKPSTQKQSLWEQKTRGYQLKDQFESYAVSERKRIEELEEQRKLNEEQIKKMEETLMQTTEGGDAWVKARDDIWKMQVENAQLINDMEEARRKLDTEMINQWQTDLTNRLAPREHEQNMLQSYQSEYQTNRQWDYYRSALGQNNEVSEQNIGLYTQYMNQMIEQLDTLEKGSEAWYAAREAVFSYEEAIAQATLSIEENNRAIEQSKVDELKDQFEQINSETNHTLNILKAQSERYDKNNNFTMYQRVIGEEINETTKQIANLEDQLRKYVDLSNDLTKDSDAWRTNQEQARNTAEQIENAKNQLEEYKRIQDQSKFEHDQEVFQRQNNLDEHQLKMIQYQQTRYQNKGELTNVNTMLGIENEQREEMISKYEKYIDILKEDLALTEKGSDEYYKIADAIYKAEEEVDNHTSAIEKNTEAIKKNEEAILKTHKALVDVVNNEVQQRVKQQKDQLSSEVSIQNQILNVIRKRYQQEWALVKEDIAKKKQALNEEKNLINERLNARLQAEDRENKYAELSELKRQLSIISSDPTRNHDVKELEKRIKDIERDIANTEAKENAQAEMDKITDQIKAMDEYAAYQEKVLNDMLKDANSTKLSEELRAVLGDDTMSAIEDRLTELIKQRAEVNERVGILKAANPNYTPGNSEDELELAMLNELIDATQSELEEAKDARFNNYMDWIRQNDENYKYGTEEFRAQMEQQNIDSWNKMLGWIDTYWDQVHDIIDGGIQNILDYMRESRSYRFAEDESAQSLIDRNLENLYEAWQDANRDDAAFTHAHDEIITEIKDEEIEINKGIHDLDGRMKDFLELYMHNIRWDYIRPTDIYPDADKIDYNDYAGWGKKTVVIGGTTYESHGHVEEEVGAPRKYSVYFTDQDGNEYTLLDKNGDERTFTSVKEAEKAMDEWVKNRKNEYDLYSGAIYRDEEYSEDTKVDGSDFQKSRSKELEYIANNVITVENIKKVANDVTTAVGNFFSGIKDSLFGFDEGGYVDFTGPAWVDGTPSKPEAFLDATDTELLRNMLDSYNYVKTLPLTMPHERNFGQQNSFGDINIVINQAEMKTGADIDNVARQVAKTFVRQLSMEGLRVNGL